MGSEEVESILQLPLQLKGVRVLLVDYDQNSLLKSTLVLRKASLKVTPTKIQQVALTILQEFKGQYSVLIISDQTQEMDCFSFVQRIKCIQEDILIIVVSSMEIDTDQGLKILNDKTCYFVNKPIDENAIINVWNRHQMRTNMNVTKEDHNRKDKKVIEDIAMDPSFMGGSSLTEMLDKIVGKDHEMQVGLKRSQPCDDQEVAKKKGKRVLEETKTYGFEAMKGRARTKGSSSGKKPIFDPEQHNKLMEAIAYNGPTKPISISHFLPKRQDFALGLQQVPEIAELYLKEKTIKEAFATTPRAPWTQYLYRKFVQAMSLSEVPGVFLGMRGYEYGYGAPQLLRYQMPYQRLPPTWMSTQDWKAQMSSEFLSRATNAGTSTFPRLGLSDQNINRGLSIGERQMQLNVNMVSRRNAFILGMNDVCKNGMDLGTKSNPIVLDEGNTSNALASDHQDTHLNEGTSNEYFGNSHSSRLPTEVQNRNNGRTINGLTSDHRDTHFLEVPSNGYFDNSHSSYQQTGVPNTNNEVTRNALASDYHDTHLLGVQSNGYFGNSHSSYQCTIAQNINNEVINNALASDHQFLGVQSSEYFSNSHSSYQHIEVQNIDNGVTSNELASNYQNTQFLGVTQSNGYFRDSLSNYLPTEVQNKNNEVTNNYSLQTEVGKMMNELIDYGQNIGSHELLNTEFASLDYIPTRTSTFDTLQNPTNLSTRNVDLPMTGFAPPYSSVNDNLDLLEVYRHQLTSVGANGQLELQNASNYQIPCSGSFDVVQDDSLQAILQGSGGIESAGSQVNQSPIFLPEWLDSFPPIREYVNPEYTNEKNADLNAIFLAATENPGETSRIANFDPNADFLAATMNQADTSTNGMNNEASQEGENILLNSQENDYDFAELFTYLDTSNEGTSLGPDQVQEANSNNVNVEVDYESYFDIDSFDLYSALND